MTILEQYKKKLTRRSSYKDYISLSLKAYKNYKLLKDSKGLANAAAIAQEGLNLYPSSARLLLLCSFFDIETGALNDAKINIDRLRPYLNYYKSSDVSVYIALTFLTALYDIKAQVKSSTAKQIKSLKKQPDSFSKLLLGYLYYELGEYHLSIKQLEESYSKGGRSFFLYLLYSRIYNNGDDSGYLLLPFIKWGLKEGFIEVDFIEDCSGLIEAIFPDHVQGFKHIYESTGSELLLRLICEKQVEEEDISQKSYKYYKEAEHRQLHIEGVPELLIKCACAYEYEDVPSHTLRTFLKNNQLDEETLPFVLYFILANPNFEGFIEEFGLKDLIWKASEWAVENLLSGRIYNSIHKYCLENSFECSKQVELSLYRDLFLANVYIDGVDEGFLYVHEDEKENMEIYEFENGFKQIRTVAGNIKIDIIDKNTGKIADVSYTTNRQVENAGAKLYKYYIDRGYNDFALYIALSGFYIKSKEPQERHIDILHKTLEAGNLSSSFRMQVEGELGNTLYTLNRRDKALEYFNRVDESRLDQKYIETMLIAFVKAYDFKRATQLIIKKRGYISDRTLLWAIKELTADYRNNMHRLLADAAYELLIKNWYDARLLDIVGKYYAGSNEDWYLLRSSLANIDLYNLALDKKILENSLWIRDFGEASQTVFNRLYQNDMEKELTSDYIYYACYEITAEDKRPSFELILNLEKHFETTGERILAYALCTAYLKFSIDTFKSHEILQKSIDFMEEDGILLPEFKGAKELKAPYIDKYWPLVHKAPSSVEVFLHYKIDDEASYSKKLMKHLFFGIFYTVIPIFYNETVEYYISEQKGEDFLQTDIKTVFNDINSLRTQQDDMFFNINNALIYEKTFKFMEVEKTLSEIIKQNHEIRGQLL